MINFTADLIDRINVTTEIESLITKGCLEEIWEVMTEVGHNVKIKESTLKGVSKINDHTIYYYHGYYFSVIGEDIVKIHNFTSEGGTNNPLQKGIDWQTGYFTYRYKVAGELNHTTRDRAYWFANHCRKVCYYELGGGDVYFRDSKSICYIQSPATSVDWFNKDQFYWIGLYNDINYIKLEAELESEENLKHLQYN